MTAASPSVKRNSLYSLFGFALPSILLFACTPALVHKLGAAGYGLWAISMATLGLMATLDLGLGGALSKYVAESVAASDTRSLSATVSLGSLIGVVLAAGFSIPLFFEAHTVAGLFTGRGIARSEVDAVVRLTALGLVPLLLRGVGVAFMVGLQRFELVMAITLTQSTSVLLAALAVSYSGGSVRDVVMSSLVILSIASAASIAVGTRLISKRGARPLFARGYLKRMVPFLAFMGASNAGSAIFESLDRLTVAAILGPVAVTYYTIPISVANKILYAADMACRPLMPAASGWLSSGQTEAAKLNLRRATVWTAGGALTVGLAGLLLSGPFMRAWMGSAFAAHALPTFRVLLVVYALLAVAAPAYHIANGIGLPWLGAVTATIGGGASIVLIVVLAPTLGVVGAACANFAYCLTLMIPLVLWAVLRHKGGAGTSAFLLWRPSRGKPS